MNNINGLALVDKKLISEVLFYTFRQIFFDTQSVVELFAVQEQLTAVC